MKLALAFSVAGKKVELSMTSDRQINSAFQYLRSSPGIKNIDFRVFNPGKKLQRSIQSILQSDVQIVEFSFAGTWTEQVNFLIVNLN